MAAHQLTQRLDPADATRVLSKNRFNDANFCHVKVRKFYVEIDGIDILKNLS